MHSRLSTESSGSSNTGVTESGVRKPRPQVNGMKKQSKSPKDKKESKNKHKKNSQTSIPQQTIVYCIGFLSNLSALGIMVLILPLFVNQTSKDKTKSWSLDSLRWFYVPYSLAAIFRNIITVLVLNKATITIVPLLHVIQTLLGIAGYALMAASQSNNNPTFPFGIASALIGFAHAQESVETYFIEITGQDNELEKKKLTHYNYLGWVSAVTLAILNSIIFEVRGFFVLCISQITIGSLQVILLTAYTWQVNQRIRKTSSRAAPRTRTHSMNLAEVGNSHVQESDGKKGKRKKVKKRERDQSRLKEWDLIKKASPCSWSLIFTRSVISYTTLLSTLSWAVLLRNRHKVSFIVIGLIQAGSLSFGAVFAQFSPKLSQRFQEYSFPYGFSIVSVMLGGACALLLIDNLVAAVFASFLLYTGIVIGPVSEPHIRLSLCPPTTFNYFAIITEFLNLVGRLLAAILVPLLWVSQHSDRQTLVFTTAAIANAAAFVVLLLVYYLHHQYLLIAYDETDKEYVLRGNNKHVVLERRRYQTLMYPERDAEVKFDVLRTEMLVFQEFRKHTENRALATLHGDALQNVGFASTRRAMCVDILGKQVTNRVIRFDSISIRDGPGDEEPGGTAEDVERTTRKTLRYVGEEMLDGVGTSTSEGKQIELLESNELIVVPGIFGDILGTLDEEPTDFLDSKSLPLDYSSLSKEAVVEMDDEEEKTLVNDHEPDNENSQRGRLSSDSPQSVVAVESLGVDEVKVSERLVARDDKEIVTSTTETSG